MAISPKKKLAICIVASLVLILAGLLVHQFNTLPSGYVAPYTVIMMWMMAFGLFVTGLMLLVVKRTRFIGMLLIGAAVVLPLTFFGGMRASLAIGLNRWVDAPLQPIGPDVSASLVVYYEIGTTSEESSELEDSLLYQVRGDGRGKEFKPGIQGFLRLLPMQANGHAGFALTFFPSMTPEARESLRSSLSNSPVVFRVYSDVAPSEIQEPQKGSDIQETTPTAR